MMIRILILAGVLGVASGQAVADPCANDASVTATQATKIQNLLGRGTEFAVLYPDGFGSWQTLNNLTVQGSGKESRSIFFDGVGMAIGTIYYRAKDGRAYNLGMAVGCSVEGAQAWFDIPAPVPPGSRRFKLELRIDVMSSKANGWAWDVATGPDPILRGGLYRDNKLVRSLTCRGDNTYSSTCLNGTIIDANENTFLVLDVKDWDDTGDDDIGTISVSLRDAIRNGGRAINVRATGQIKSVALKLVPVE